MKAAKHARQPHPIIMEKTETGWYFTISRKSAAPRPSEEGRENHCLLGIGETCWKRRWMKLKRSDKETAPAWKTARLSYFNRTSTWYEKNNDVKYDFLTDPIETEIDGGRLLHNLGSRHHRVATELLSC